MPSQNSPKTNSDKPSAAVSTAFVTRVLKAWEKMIAKELSFDIDSLVAAADWQYQEALCCLCRCLLDALGVAKPTAELLSLVGVDIDDKSWCRCELVIIWSAAASLNPGDVLDDCVVTSVVNFPLPHQFMFVGGSGIRRSVVKRWTIMLSKIVDDLPKKES